MSIKTLKILFIWIIYSSLLSIGSLAYSAETWKSGQTHFWVAYGLTGGGTALDGKSGASLSITDFSTTIVGANDPGKGVTVYFHRIWNSGSTSTPGEDSPAYIVPDDLQSGGKAGPLGDSTGTTTWVQVAVSGATIIGNVFVLDTRTITTSTLDGWDEISNVTKWITGAVSIYATDSGVTPLITSAVSEYNTGTSGQILGYNASSRPAPLDPMSAKEALSLNNVPNTDHSAQNYFDLDMDEIEDILAGTSSYFIGWNFGGVAVKLGGKSARDALSIYSQAETDAKYLSGVTDISALLESGGAWEIKLDDLGSLDDNVDLNASAAAHGLLPKLSGNAAEYLNGTGGWASPAGSGDVTAAQLNAHTNEAAFQNSTGGVSNFTPWSSVTPIITSAVSEYNSGTSNEMLGYNAPGRPVPLDPASARKALNVYSQAEADAADDDHITDQRVSSGTSGQVSFYNESTGTTLFPLPNIVKSGQTLYFINESGETMFTYGSQGFRINNGLYLLNGPLTIGIGNARFQFKNTSDFWFTDSTGQTNFQNSGSGLSLYATFFNSPGGVINSGDIASGAIGPTQLRDNQERCSIGAVLAHATSLVSGYPVVPVAVPWDMKVYSIDLIAGIQTGTIYVQAYLYQAGASIQYAPGSLDGSAGCSFFAYSGASIQSSYGMHDASPASGTSNLYAENRLDFYAMPSNNGSGITQVTVQINGRKL